VEVVVHHLDVVGVRVQRVDVEARLRQQAARGRALRRTAVAGARFGRGAGSGKEKVVKYC
jgi:hypothetical protein